MAVTIIQAKDALETALQQTARNIFAVSATKKPTGPIVIGLCGGRSVVGLLGALLKESQNQPKDVLGRIHFFMVDERLVPLTDDQSNYGGLKKLLFDSLLAEGVISPAQLHPFDPNPSLPDYGSAPYLEELEKLGGAFTVAVVGVGEDGHIAGLFPGHQTLKRQGREFLTFHDSPKAPLQRMTASPGLISGADLAIVLLLGEGKRDAWNAFNSPDSTVEKCPALIAKSAAQCVVVTDLA